MDNLQQTGAVVKMKDFIQNNLNRQITLKMLSNACGYSPFHCTRIFKQQTGKTLFEYIRLIRLSRAASLLRDGDVKIIDVAFDFVFDSHEGFTRAFSKQFGVTPQYYSKKSPAIKFFIPNNVRDFYLSLQKGVNAMPNKNEINTVFVQVIDRPERKLILKRGKKAEGYFEYCEEVGCDVWNVLSNIKEALYEPIGIWLPKKMILPNTSLYAQGVEVPTDYTSEIPKGYEIIDLSPCKMMVFQGKPFKDQDFEQAIGDIWETMKDYDPTLYGFEWADDDAPRFQLAPMGYRGYIEARSVRELNKK